jgi:hypothetical protein
MLRGGVQQVRVVLTRLDAVAIGQGGKRAPNLPHDSAHPQAIRKVGHRYPEGGLERALYEGNGAERRKCWMTTKNNG